MRKHNKKIAAGIIALAMMSGIGMSVYSDEEEKTEDTAAAEEETEKDEEEEATPITEEEALSEMELVTENDRMSLYLSNDKDDPGICLIDKNSGKRWFSNPVNAVNTKAKKAQKNELLSGMTMIYAEPAARSTTTLNSKSGAKVTAEKLANGIKFTYSFDKCKVTIPVTLTLESDHLSLSCVTSEIVEENSSPTSGQLTTALSFMKSFGAADRETEGYFVIPDGSGAIIRFNNGKTNYRVYQGKVYGDDITPVEPTVTQYHQNVYLNMYGIVSGDSGMVVVADKGDAAATINAYVAGEINTDYNGCYFSFTTRTDDEYLMGGESNPLKVFEKRGIKVPEIKVDYYPVSSNDGSDIDYIDIADTYRDYLMESCGVTVSSKVDSTPLYMNMYGSTIKKQSIIGIPVDIKEKVTTFEDAKGILEKINEGGVDSAVISFKDWTSAEVAQKITDKASAASVLGGNGKFKKLLEYANSKGMVVYPDVDNMLFKSSFGYSTITNTAIRVSNSYSRQLVYDLAHGTENKYYKSMALFTPSSYEKAFTKLSKSYNQKGLSNISLGSLSTTIYGDYGKVTVSREMAKDIIAGVYADAKSNVGSVMADGANKYVLPYVDSVANLPLSSSKYDLFDEEIPFYQIVLRGMIPCSTTAINAEPDIADAVLYALSCGQYLSFDMIGIEASELKDTRYDKYFYADAEKWTDDAVGAYKLQCDILSSVADNRITEYNISEDGNEIETVYDDGTTTLINYEENTIKLNGTTYKLSEYFSEGVVD